MCIALVGGFGKAFQRAGGGHDATAFKARISLLVIIPPLPVTGQSLSRGEVLIIHRLTRA